jgi:hypothetical protein
MSTLTGPLNETERWILVNALRLAAERYEDFAQDSKDAERIQKQFASQALSARKWADLIEECEEISIT